MKPKHFDSDCCCPAGSLRYSGQPTTRFSAGSSEPMNEGNVGGKEAEEIAADETAPADKLSWHAVT